MDKHTEEIIKRLTASAEEKETVIAAIDGRCASGKTTLAENIRRETVCNIFHMDDFFLHPQQRTKERLEIPGENADHERFYSDVLTPLLSGKDFSYRPYICKTGALGDPVHVTAKRINIIEGSYSCHPQLIDCYDLRIFLTVGQEEQMERIIRRNGIEAAEVFKNRWIPLEEKYFAAFDIPEKSHILIET